MKKFKLCILTIATVLIIVVINFVCCWINSTTFETRDIAKYNIISTKIKKISHSQLSIFPQRIPDSAEDVKYYCYYKTGPLDPKCQVFLECSLSDKEYNSELNRLKDIKVEFKKDNVIHSIVKDEKNFKHSAYVTAFEEDFTYEYALEISEQKKIIYIYTQFIKPNEIKFNKDYLSVNYNNYMKDGKSNRGFNIYYISSKETK